jgi:HNH endonuclease
MKKAGELDLSVPKGVWRLNESGIARAKTDTTRLQAVARHGPAPIALQKVLGLAPTTPMASDLPDAGPATRAECTTYRILRDTEIARRVKNLYGYRCQVCHAEGIRFLDGTRYAEAHHVWPLGDDGPDIEENVVCVCPNCHVLLDYQVVQLDFASLQHPAHSVDPKYVQRHNAIVAAKSAMAENKGGSSH